jgi:hypothetical protein
VDGIFSTLLGKMIATGGGYLVAAIMVVLYWLERRETAKLQDTVIGLAVGQTEAATKTEVVLSRMEELIQEIARSLR